MRFVKAIVAGLCAGVLTAVPSQASSSGPDPAVPGPYATVAGEYDLPPVVLPELDEPVEMRAKVVAPRGVTGPAPLVVLVHGFFPTCYGDGSVLQLWPCPEGSSELMSYRGYEAIAQQLASWGYVTVSLSANGVTNQAIDLLVDERTRAALIRLHLSRWADWSGAGRDQSPEAVRAAPPADLSRVLLIGHSRGGDAANRAAMDSIVAPPDELDNAPVPVRWRIRGTILLGATAVGRNPVADVPSLSILPECDGDAKDLASQVYVDGTRDVGAGVALHSAVFLPGANHNFFNSEWTPGESAGPGADDVTDTTDPRCSAGSPHRMTAAEQRAAAAASFVAAARLFLDGDDRMRPFLDGTAPGAPARSHALGGSRAPLVIPAADLSVTGDGSLCRLSACGLVNSPHVLSGADPGRFGVSVSWSSPGRPVILRPAHPSVIDGATALTMRVVVPPNSIGTTFDVAVSDRAGRRSTLGRVQLNGLPGTELTKSAWAQEVRVPLTPAVDRRGITSLELVPRNADGRLWLLDAWGWRPGIPDPGTPTALRVDLQDANGSVEAGQLTVPARVAGTGVGVVFVTASGPNATRTSHAVTVRPGDSSIVVPIEGLVAGKYTITAVPLRNVVVGDYKSVVRMS
ncbi:hypothetical protein [Catenuloplanes indicus]|uniref:Dienelactone hydrolase n=1 Tax=Catenuloplanes indicus TaxID=137267 RepID=A0AAE4AWH3_9ACTN|nr:hypothetical protein [Catenuloplanes indicus]MDQ0365012.1 dienelactone hydrolase [Catenuloplanes indicus]